MGLEAAWVVVMAAKVALGADGTVTTVDRVPAVARNPHYPCNREPLAPSPLIKLPVGAVQPRGWLKKQLELQADGFHGHLGEISPWLRKENNAWLSKNGQGEYGWEEVPYWLKGYIACAAVLGRKDQMEEAKTWIEGAIASQEPNGMFGPRGQGAKSTVESTTGPLDLWPNMVMLNFLETYYEVTGDQRVIDLMTKYFAFELTIPDKEFLPPYWQNQRGADNLASVYWLYNHTGDPSLLKLAEKVHRCTANWNDGIPDWHNVNMSQAFGGPATFYQQSHDLKHLAAAERNYNEIRERFGQVPGGMFGGDENCREGFTDPRQAIETCGMVEMMLSCERLESITGDVVWADRCEDVAFNSLPAAILADFHGLRYLTAPNHVQSDRASKAPGIQNGGNMYEMRADDHRCCQHNFGHGWPYFAEHQWMATSDSGLAAVFYCPSSVSAKVGAGNTVTITSKTTYPFSDRVSMSVECAAPEKFPLYLRVPGWCSKGAVMVNGQPADMTLTPRTYVRIEREWHTGDTVTITLPMDVSVRGWRKNHDAVSVERGPLTYSLKIGEKYVPTTGPKPWVGCEILPTTAWNYGLVLDGATPGESFQVVERSFPDSMTPFTQESAPVELKAKGKRIPQWKQDYLGLVGLLQDSPVKSSEPEERITLIPMGAARLRVSSFPVISDAPSAHEWVTPPEAKPTRASASHCFGGDSVRAVEDGRIPKKSSDHSIPRFTWWDHRGTKEWVQREFDRASVSKVRVYWFDDEPVGGKCRTPESWRVMYRKDGQWAPVTGASASGVTKDQFNDVTFDAVTTDALRLEVKLRDGFSSGVLEWEIK